MNAQALRKELIEAKNCAKIVLTFVRYNKDLDPKVAADLLLHFAKNFLVVFIEYDTDTSTVTLAKTPLFTEADAKEIADRLYKFILKIEVRQIPDVTLNLVETDSDWKLILSGGNKLYRQIFSTYAVTSGSKKFTCDVTTEKDAEGVLELKLIEKPNGDLLGLAQEISEVFKTKLVM